MKAWLTSRRIRPGHEQEFRQQWAHGKAPAGMVNAYVLDDDQHTGETLTLSLWNDEAKLTRYRDSSDAAERERGISGAVDQTLWHRTFDVRHAADLADGSRGGNMAWLLRTAVLGAAGVGAWTYRSRMEEKRKQEARLAARMQARMPSPRPVWLAAPAAAVAAGTGLFFLIKKLRGAPDEETYQPWQETSTTMTARPATVVSSSTSTSSPTTTASRGNSAEQTTRSSAANSRYVQEIMTRDPETINYDTDLTSAAAKMRDLNVGVLPVLADGQLAGIITDRDLALAMAGGGNSRDRRVQDVMTEAPVTITPRMTVSEAAKLMADHQIRRLPVTEGTKLVGIISLGDLAVDGSDMTSGETLEQISKPSEPQR